MTRAELTRCRRVVVKIGSSLLAPPQGGVHAQRFAQLARDVTELIAQGRNNQWIARHFVLSPKTIRNHVSNIFTKLQVADRAEAIVRAREAGLGQAGTR